MTSLSPLILSSAGASNFTTLPSVNPGSIGLHVSVSGTGTYKVQLTMWDPNWVMFPSFSALFPTKNFNNDASWFDHPTLTGLTATAAGNIIIPCMAARLYCASYTNGSAVLVVCPGNPVA